MSLLIELSNLCEKASGADPRLDARISCAIKYPTLRPARPEDHLEYQKGHPPGPGDIWCPTGFLMATPYTRCMDDAISLVPEGWFWRVGHTTSFQAWAVVNRTHPDHCETDKDEFFANREHWNPSKWTPVLALCAAALRARASTITSQPRGSETE